MVELRISFFAQLWWLNMMVWGEGIQETIRCSLQTSELMLTDDVNSYS